MDQIQNRVEDLLESIRESEVYKTYREKAQMVAEHPEWKEQIDTLRRTSYQLYENDDWFDEADRLNEQFSQLRKIPEVNAYLEAELDVCKLLQKIAAYTVSNLDIHIPEMEIL